MINGEGILEEILKGVGFEMKSTKEYYKKSMETYRHSYNEMTKLCERMLAEMKKQMWITGLLVAFGYVGGIFLGMALQGRFG